MKENTDFCIVLCSTPDQDIAKRIATHLVDHKLAGCVNIIPNLTSIYRWQDKLCEETEYLMLIKTKHSCYSELEKAIKNSHPYEIPEIILLNVEQGLPEYLKWLADSLR